MRIEINVTMYFMYYVFSKITMQKQLKIRYQTCQFITLHRNEILKSKRQTHNIPIRILQFHLNRNIINSVIGLSVVCQDIHHTDIVASNTINNVALSVAGTLISFIVPFSSKVFHIFSSFVNLV